MMKYYKKKNCLYNYDNRLYSKNYYLNDFCQKNELVDGFLFFYFFDRNDGFIYNKCTFMLNTKILNSIYSILLELTVFSILLSL